MIITSNINLFFCTAYCSKKCLLEVEIVRYPLSHWCRTVRTLWHHSDGAEMSWVRSVLGPKCLDTISVTHVADQPFPRYFIWDSKGHCICIAEGKCNFMFYWHVTQRWDGYSAVYQCSNNNNNLRLIRLRQSAQPYIDYTTVCHAGQQWHTHAVTQDSGNNQV